MKNLTTCLLLLLLTSPSFAQIVDAQLSGAPRATPLIGMNTNAHHTVANWMLPDFVDSVASLNSAILRYPGGTVSNHWDWQTGWFQNSPCTPPNLANINPVGSATPAEFKVGLDASQASALMVVNVQCSDINYQLQGLAHAESVGIPIDYVELGNEHNLTISSQFISPSVYDPIVAEWADSIKTYYPNSKICAVGSEPPSQQQWHDSIFIFQPDIDALSFHIYLGAGNSDGFFNTRRALSVPFNQLLTRYTQSHFNEAPANVEVWATEYNLGELLNGTIAQHRDTWTHGLYFSVMSHLMLQVPRITMLINHNLTNQLDFAAIDPNTHRITANGVASLLLGEASKGLPTAEEINFPNQPTLLWQSVSYPSLIGWRFTDGGTTRAWVCNLSDDAASISMDGILGNSFSYHQHWADSNFVVSGLASLNGTISSSETDVVVLQPFSISVFENNMSVGVEAVQEINPLVRQEATSVFLQTESPTSLSVIDALGRNLYLDNTLTRSRAIDSGAWPVGIYLFTFRSGEVHQTVKVVVRH